MKKDLRAKFLKLGATIGGHFLIFGQGDDDATWGKMVLVGPAAPLVRKAD